MFCEDLPSWEAASKISTATFPLQTVILGLGHYPVLQRESANDWFGLDSCFKSAQNLHRIAQNRLIYADDYLLCTSSLVHSACFALLRDA